MISTEKNVSNIILLWAAVPSLFGTRDGFRGRQFFHGLGVGEGFRIIQAYYIYCVLYFCYGYVSSTSDHQALDPRVWGPPCRNQEDKRWLSLEFRRGFFPWLQNVKLALWPFLITALFISHGRGRLSRGTFGSYRGRWASQSSWEQLRSTLVFAFPPLWATSPSAGRVGGEIWATGVWPPMQGPGDCRPKRPCVLRGEWRTLEGMKGGEGGKVGRSSFGPWALCLWRGKGHHVFHSFAPRSPQWLDISFEWEVANSAFKKLYAAILFALGSCPGRPPQQDRVNSLVCVCVGGGTLRFVHEPTFESRHPVGGESDRTDNRNVT